MTAPQKVDLLGVPGDGGVVWSASPEGVHVNLVVLAAGGRIAAHRNDALDVLVVVVAGAGALEVDGDRTALGAGDAVLVPRGAVRSIEATGGGLRYLTVHGRPAPMGIGHHR